MTLSHSNLTCPALAGIPEWTRFENLNARAVFGFGPGFREGNNERNENNENSLMGLRAALHLVGVRAGFDDGLIFAKFRSFRCFHFPCEVVAGGGYVVSRTLHRHRLGAVVLTLEQVAQMETTRMAVNLTDYIGSVDVVLRFDWNPATGTWKAGAGEVAGEKQSYNAWGERRNGNDGSELRGSVSLTCAGRQKLRILGRMEPRIATLRNGKSWARIFLLLSLLLHLVSCDRESKVGSGVGEVTPRDPLVQDWGSGQARKCEIIVGDHLRIAKDLEEFEDDPELGVIGLRWSGGSLSLKLRDDFLASPIFQGRSLDKIVEDFSFDNPKTESDDHLRQRFLEGSDGGVIEGDGNIMVFRYDKGHEGFSGVIVNQKSERYVHFVGIVKAEPRDWKPVAIFLFSSIEVL